MRYVRPLSVVGAAFLLVAIALADDAPLDITTANGMVEKVDKDSVTVLPRGAGGKFTKKVVLKLTGTSKFTMVNMEKRGAKMVPVQRDVGPKDLESKQHITVIFTSGDDPVLLSAVVQKGK